MKELSCTYTLWLARSAPGRRDRRARGRPLTALTRTPRVPSETRAARCREGRGRCRSRWRARRIRARGRPRPASRRVRKARGKFASTVPVSAVPAARPRRSRPLNPSPLCAPRARGRRERPPARPPQARSRLSRTVKPAGSPVFMSFSTSSSFSPGSSTCLFVDGARPKRPATGGRRDATRRGARAGRVRGRSRAAHTRR